MGKSGDFGKPRHNLEGGKKISQMLPESLGITRCPGQRPHLENSIGQIRPLIPINIRRVIQGAPPGNNRQHQNDMDYVSQSLHGFSTHR